MGTSDLSATYPGGMEGLLQHMEARRAPLEFAQHEDLPPLNTDLSALTRRHVPAPEDDPIRHLPYGSSNHRKHLELRKELVGRSELAVLHGLLVAHLRKRRQPAHTDALFERIWKEHPDHLLEQLNLRWQVSAITTFGDHGRSAVQRQVGTGLSVLFGTMKLYESERRYSGKPSDKPFALNQLRHGPLPLDMDAFSLRNGGLDVNMLGRLWALANEDDAVRPLAHNLLDMLLHDPRSVFRRLRIMRQRLSRSSPPDKQGTKNKVQPNGPRTEAPIVPVLPRARPCGGAPTWGVVCTTNASLGDVQSWVAHHLSHGADRLYLYLDQPDPDVSRALQPLQKVTLTVCDGAFWRDRGRSRPEAHQQRQSHNATVALHQTELDFLAHFDIDEFLVSPRSVSESLAECPPDAAFARVRPVELLAPLEGAPRHFKRTPHAARQSNALLETLYPTFGPYLSGGFTGHTSGKIFARTGIPKTRLGIHWLRYHGDVPQNFVELPEMSLAHLHYRNAAHFIDRCTFRLTQGSYRKAPEKQDRMRLSDVLAYLSEKDGAEGLRGFFEEVCTARPELLALLDTHNMLFTHDLALAEKTATFFGQNREAAERSSETDRQHPSQLARRSAAI